jgi:hypothetical protein
VASRFNELLDHGGGNGHKQTGTSRTVSSDARRNGWLGANWIFSRTRPLRNACQANFTTPLLLRVQAQSNALGNGERRMPDDRMRAGDSSLGENRKSETTV